MPHFGDDVEILGHTATKWLKLGAEIGRFCNEHASRGDLTAHVASYKGIAGGAAAAFSPSEAAVEVNLDKTLGANFKPAWIGDFTERTTQFTFPKLTGAVLHESGHARYTLWRLDRLAEIRQGRAAGLAPGSTDPRDADERLRDGRLAELVELFEEPRIERHMARIFPTDGVFLRASAMELVISDTAERMKAEPPGVFQLSRVMILSQGRVAAEVLAAEDIEALTEQFKTVFDEKVYPGLCELLEKAVRVAEHREADRKLLELAGEWLDLLPEDSDEDAAAKAGEAFEALGSGGAGVLEDVSGDVEIEAVAAVTAQRRTEEREAAEAVAAAEAADDAKSDAAEKDVFGRGRADFNGATRSRPGRKRMPTADERSAVIVLARELEKARYRERESVRTKSAAPPGRLNVRELVRVNGARAAGVRGLEVQPWKGKRYTETEEPNLTIAMMGDISGSMDSAMEPMAVTQYVLANAGARVNAQVASVYFGNSAFPTLRAGEKLDWVTPWSAPDGTHRFDSAFRALDKHLGLLKGKGARLLVIASDLHYSGSEITALDKWTQRCVGAGVGVMVLSFSYTADFARLPPQAITINGRQKPVEAAQLIGQAAVKALAAVGLAR